MNTFENLEIWKEGVELTVKIYQSLKDCRDYGFKDQIQRAAVSVPSNISEGFERQTNKKFIQYLFIAKGSCGELQTQLYIAQELKYIEENDFNTLFYQARSLSAKIAAFIKTRRR